MGLENPPEKQSWCAVRSRAGRVSLLLLYLHAKVKAHPARPELSFTPCTSGAAVEKGTGKEKQQEQQEQAKHGPASRWGKSHCHLLWQKTKTVPWTSSSLWFIPSFSNTACFLLEENSTKKTLMHLATAFCQKGKAQLS